MHLKHWSWRAGKGETLAAVQPILILPPGRTSPLPLIFLTTVSGQRSHTDSRLRRAERMAPTLTLSARQPPASATAATTSSRVTESSSPVILSSAVHRGTVTLAVKSFIPQGGLAFASLWGLANPRSRSQGDRRDKLSLTWVPMYSAGKVAGSVRRLITVTFSLRGLG